LPLLILALSFPCALPYQISLLFATPVNFYGARIYPGHTGSILDAPAKTIKAGDHGVPGGENMIRFANGTVRYLTVLEAKRLQTFPDDFVIKGVWGEAMRQIGNAVPVLLAEKIGCELMKSLNFHVDGARIIQLKFTSSQEIGSSAGSR
jgi:C-5 cytosine-specific DNA methylase